LRALLRKIQPEARDREAYFIHFDDASDLARSDPSFSTPTMTEIKVSFRKTAPSLEKALKAFEVVLGAFYPNGKVTLKSQGPFQIQQMTAHEAIFEVRPAETGMLYYHYVMVPLAAGGELEFLLVADSSRHTARATTFKQILGSLQVR
jgi:hypothetical protein